MADAVFSAQRDMIADLGRTAAQRRVSIVAIKPTTSASSTRLAPLMREHLDALVRESDSHAPAAWVATESGLAERC